MSDSWFTPHTYGYGATPSNWKGWAAIAAFIAVLTVASVVLISPAAGSDAPTTARIVAWLLLVTLLTIGFIGFCRAKTDGQWRWRWGE
jgi:hypothetical protein